MSLCTFGMNTLLYQRLNSSVLPLAGALRSSVILSLNSSSSREPGRYSSCRGLRSSLYCLPYRSMYVSGVAASASCPPPRSRNGA